MAVRLSRPKFTWIIYISLFPWLTTYAKSVDSAEDSIDDEETSIEHAPTMQTTDVENWLTTPIDIFNSTGIEDLVELTMPTKLKLKSEEYIETNSSMIGLYVGLPVGLFLILAVLAVICYIFRGKLKIVAGKFRRTHKEGLYQEPKMMSNSSTRNDTSRTFSNQEYEMHNDQENSKSEYTSNGAYEFSKSRSEPERNEPFHYNTIETETKSYGFKYRPEYETIGTGESCNTYDTVYHAAQESFNNLSYDNILGSNASLTKASHGNEGSTEYDNAAV